MKTSSVYILGLKIKTDYRFKDTIKEGMKKVQSIADEMGYELERSSINGYPFLGYNYFFDLYVIDEKDRCLYIMRFLLLKNNTAYGNEDYDFDACFCCDSGWEEDVEIRRNGSKRLRDVIDYDKVVNQMEKNTVEEIKESLELKFNELYGKMLLIEELTN
ncbi:hypothetical protein D3C76_02150 [compost metagenome]